MRVRRRLAATLLLGAAMTAAAAAQPSRTMPPNFVLILADDLGYGDVEINGASVNRTPNLARLAAEGIRLTSFYAAGNWCMPTRASILTASYPKRIGLDQGSDALSPDARSRPRARRGRDHAARAPALGRLRHGARRQVASGRSTRLAADAARLRSLLRPAPSQRRRAAKGSCAGARCAATPATSRSR